MTLKHATPRDIEAMRDFMKEAEYAHARAEMLATHDRQKKELGLG